MRPHHLNIKGSYLSLLRNYSIYLLINWRKNYNFKNLSQVIALNSSFKEPIILKIRNINRNLITAVDEHYYIVVGHKTQVLVKKSL